MRADHIWKDILEKLFAEFLQFFFPDIYGDIDFGKGYQFLDKEFQQITKDAKAGKRIVDKLVKVFLKDGKEQWILIHIEIQGQKEKDFARRMFIYNYRIFDKYQKDVISLALLTDSDNNYRPDVFEIKRWGFRLQYKFPLVKIIDYINYDFEREYKINPFSMVTQAYLKTVETEGDNQSRYKWRKRFILSLYELGLKRETIYAIYQFIEWLMELPEELEEQLYQEIKEQEDETMSLLTIAEKKGLEQGLQQGLQQGIQQGVIQGLQKAIQTALEIKFGTEVWAIFNTEIEDIKSVEMLEKVLREANLATSLEDFKSRFNRLQEK